MGKREITAAELLELVGEGAKVVHDKKPLEVVGIQDLTDQLKSIASASLAASQEREDTLIKAVNELTLALKSIKNIKGDKVDLSPINSLVEKMNVPIVDKPSYTCDVQRTAGGFRMLFSPVKGEELCH